MSTTTTTTGTPTIPLQISEVHIEITPFFASFKSTGSRLLTSYMSYLDHRANQRAEVKNKHMTFKPIPSLCCHCQLTPLNKYDSYIGY